MQHALAEKQNHTTPGQLPRLRFRPVMHLGTGDLISTLCQSRVRFGETVDFGPGEASRLSHSPAAWLADHLEDAAETAEMTGMHTRPIIVKAPLAALTHAHTGIACETAIRRTHLCPQEICIEIEDGAVALSMTEGGQHVRALRRRGFRVSLDARKAWNTSLDSRMRLMLDAMRIDAEKLYASEDLQTKCTIATAAGISVIAERARWRDADALSALGVHYAIAPRTDA